MKNKNTWLKLGSLLLKGAALALPYIADRFIDSRIDAEESEEFVREVVRDELERKGDPDEIA